MGSSIMPPVSPFSYPQTGAIPIQSPLPGSADRSQSQEVTLMSFEQDGPPRKEEREGGVAVTSLHPLNQMAPAGTDWVLVYAT